MRRLSLFATEPLSGEQICESPATVFALHNPVVLPTDGRGSSGCSSASRSGGAAKVTISAMPDAAS